MITALVVAIVFLSVGLYGLTVLVCRLTARLYEVQLLALRLGATLSLYEGALRQAGYSPEMLAVMPVASAQKTNGEKH